MEWMQILVLGKNNLSIAFLEILMQHNIHYSCIDNVHDFEKHKGCTHAFMLSSNDFDNIFLSNIANHMMHIPHVFAICNENENRTIFNDNKINFFLQSEISAVALFDYSIYNMEKRND